jgi:hypothetical protein
LVPSTWISSSAHCRSCHWVSSVWHEKYLYYFLLIIYIICAKETWMLVFLGIWVYPRALESNFLSPKKIITMRSSITQLVITLKLRNTDMNNSVSRNMTPCRLAHYYQLVGRACRLHLYSLTVLKTESKTST